MRNPAGSIIALAVILNGWGLSCSDREPFVVLTIRDPYELASDWSSLWLGYSLAGLAPVHMDRMPFPLNLTITGAREGPRRVWTEVRGESDLVLARGTAVVALRRSGTPVATLDLHNACVDDAECTAIGFCSGTKRCVDTVCTCVETLCGDGLVDPLVEQCDDGNQLDDDACTSDCRSAVCGDGITWLDQEVCDDGNTQSGDGCRADCRKEESCGDGLLDLGESCDDGNTNLNDGCHVCRETRWSAQVVAGLGDGGGDPTKAALHTPYDVAVDRWQNVYLADSGHFRIRRIDASGVMTTVAGNGIGGFAGDGGPATSAQMLTPASVVVDGVGNVFFADYRNGRVRKVAAAAGIVSTVAGDGSASYYGDGGPATHAAFQSPTGLHLDGLGNLYIADTYNHCIRLVDHKTGIITTAVGQCTIPTAVDPPEQYLDNLGDGQHARSATLSGPFALTFDAQGNMFIADRGNDRVRMVSAMDGTITTIYGPPGLPDPIYYRRDFPNGIVAAADGSVYVALAYRNRIIRLVRQHDLTWISEHVAGTGVSGCAGDGGPATLAQVSLTNGLELDQRGNLYLAEWGSHRVRRINLATGIIDTLAGTGVSGLSGDNGRATSAPLNNPTAVVLDPQGQLQIVDTNNGRVRMVDLVSGIIRSTAGSGSYNHRGFSGDDGPALEALMNSPVDVAFDAYGNMYIADNGNHRIRRVDAATGLMSTWAGNGSGAFFGDDGPATEAALFNPHGLVVDGIGDILFADKGNHRIRKIDHETGVITTIVGDGISAWVDGPAATARLSNPQGVAIDQAGNVLILDSGNNRVRKLDNNGVVSTIMGSSYGYNGDGILASAAKLASPGGFCLDAAGNLFIADTNNHRIRRVDAQTGIIDTIAGTGTAGAFGDGGLAINARVFKPSGVVVHGNGDVYIADSGNSRVRRIEAGVGTITTIAGAVFPPGDGDMNLAYLGAPASLLRRPGDDSLVLTDMTHGRLRTVNMSANVVSTMVGYPQGVHWLEEGAPVLLSRELQRPWGLAMDPLRGDLWVSERNGHQLRVVSQTGSGAIITTYVGRLPRSYCCGLDGIAACTSDENANPICADNSPGFAGDDGYSDRDAMRFSSPAGLAFAEASRTLYVADSGNHVVRAINVDTGAIRTLAGTPGMLGDFGDQCDAKQALFNSPIALAVAADGSVYIADDGNNRVHRVAPDGIVENVLGDGTRAASGEGSPARYFPVDQPAGLAVDPFGNLFVSSRHSIRLIFAGTDGVATGDDRVTTIYGKSPRDSFPEPVTQCLTGLLIEDGPFSQIGARVWALDSCAGFLLALDRQSL